MASRRRRLYQSEQKPASKPETQSETEQKENDGESSTNVEAKTTDAAREEHEMHLEQGLQRLEKAKQLIQKAALYSAPNGIIPLPVANYLTLVLIQARLIKQVGRLYGQQSSLGDLKKIVSVLVGCYVTEYFSNSGLLRHLRLLPGLGTLVGTGISAGFYYYSTKLIGEIFLTHFESKGTFLSFAPDEAKKYYSRTLKQYLKG